MSGQYLRLLSRPAVAWPFGFAVLARFPIAMAPLGIIVLIEELRGSYASAGLVTGAFALATATSAPIWGGLMDRVGQPRVVISTALTSAACLVALTLLAVAGAADAVLIALAIGVGLSFPPIGPAMRVAWSTILPDLTERRGAYALDAVAVETIFVAGPLFLALLLPTPAAVPLLATAGLMAVGGIGYSRTLAARTWQATPRDRTASDPSRSPLADRGVVLTLMVGLFMAIGFGQLDVAMTATAELIVGNQAILGVFFTCVAGGSAIGGLWYGSRNWRGPERLHLPIYLTGFATGLAAVALTLRETYAPLGLMLPALFLTGLCISPGLIVQQALVDGNAPVDRQSEGQGWLTTALTSGGAIGMALAGFVVDHAGPRMAFGTASLAIVAAALVAVLAQRRWR